MTTPTMSSGTRTEGLRVPELHPSSPEAVHGLRPTSEAPLIHRVAPHVPGSPIAPISRSTDQGRRRAVISRWSQA